jgi:hypothetical protein
LIVPPVATVAWLFALAEAAKSVSRPTAANSVASQSFLLNDMLLSFG